MDYYYYISDINYENNTIISNTLDQNKLTGITVYTFEGIIKSEILNNPKYCYIFEVILHTDSILIKTEQDNIFISNKFSITPFNISNADFILKPRKFFP